MYTIISIRFYEELNDFLDPEKKKQSFIHTFKGISNIKDIIESLGVPHPEVDLILVNGHSVDFNYKPNNNDRISVYPVFESLDISPIIRLRPNPLRELNFVLDVHLGKLARYLRLLGFNVMYSNQYSDQDLIKISTNEKRIILTRDVNLLKNKVITHGYWIRNTAPKQQLKEVMFRFDLRSKILPFIRCLECNGLLELIEKKEILQKIPSQVSKNFENFHKCRNCHKIYWKGSHYDKMAVFVEKLMYEL